MTRLASAVKSVLPSSSSCRLTEGLGDDGIEHVFAVAMQSDEPTMRNSNLLPVKANGEVRLRSVASLLRTGSVETPVDPSWPPALQPAAVPVLHDLLHNILELIAEEDGDNGGRRLVRAEAVVISDARPWTCAGGPHGGRRP